MYITHNVFSKCQIMILTPGKLNDANLSVSIKIGDKNIND